MPTFTPPTITREDLASLRAKYGAELLPPIRPQHETHPRLICITRRASRDEYKRFRAMWATLATKHDAYEFLARAVLVFPAAENFEAMFEAAPGIDVAIGDFVLEHAGAGAHAEVVSDDELFRDRKG